jgi:hypothetical protein
MTVLQTVSSAKVVYEAIGSDPAKIKESRSPNGTTVDIIDWFTSSNMDNAVFIDIGRDGLIPLYKLIADPVRKIEVQNYTARFLIAQQVKLSD